jgi:hypothetical protein
MFVLGKTMQHITMRKKVSGGLLATTFTAILLSACGGGGGAGAGAGGAIPPATIVQAPSTTELSGVAQNLAGEQRADGAILYTNTEVEPYFANIAEIGAVHAGVDMATVQRWMQWYVARSKDPNPWSIPGAITDYSVQADGSLRTTGEADSVDSYAATFISLAATAWREGDAPLRSYVAGLQTDIERIASAIDAVSDTDGLTWALPTYRLKYVMDNSEVYRGLVDLAALRSGAFGDLAGSLRASSHALQIQNAIATTYWDGNRGAFAVALDASGNKIWPQAGNWYDQTTQLFPILHGVVDPASQQAQTAYAQFSSAFPGWPSLQKPDPFPWASIAFVALQMNDVARANTYANTVQGRYAPGFAYPWYCAESGWYLRVLLGLDAPQTVAVL